MHEPIHLIRRSGTGQDGRALEGQQPRENGREPIGVTGQKRGGQMCYAPAREVAPHCP